MNDFSDNFDPEEQARLDQILPEEPDYVVVEPDDTVPSWIVLTVFVLVGGALFGLGFLVALWTGVTC